MAILVKHSGNAAPALVGAFGGGQGKRQAEDSRQALDLIDREKSRQAASLESARNRAHQEAMAAREARERRKAIEEGREWELEREKRMREYGMEDREAEQQARRDDFEWQLTTKQKMELNRIADAEAAMEVNPDVSDPEKKEYRRMFAELKAGFQPVWKPRDPTPAELFKSNTHYDPATGKTFALDERGLPGKAIIDPPAKEQSWQDKTARDKLWLDAHGKAMILATPATGPFNQAVYDSYMENVKARLSGDSTGAPGAEGAAGGEEADMFSLPPIAPGAVNGGVKIVGGPLESPKIAGFPPELWSKMDEADRTAAMSVFKSGIPIGKMISSIRAAIRAKGAK